MFIAFLTPVAAAIIIEPGDGLQIGASVDLSSDHASAPRTVVDGAGPLATWREQRTGTTCVVAARLDASGRPNAKIELGCTKQLTGGPAISATSNASLVVWGDGSELVGVVVSKALQATPGFRLKQPRSDVLGLEVAHDAHQFWVGWATCAEALLQGVDTTGKLLGAPRVVNDRPELGSSLWIGNFISNSWLSCSGNDCEIGFDRTTRINGNDRLDDHLHSLGDKVDCAAELARTPHSFMANQFGATLAGGVLAKPEQLVDDARSAANRVGLRALGPRPLIETDRYPISEFAVAETSVGALVATVTVDDVPRKHLRLQFIHARPDAARHEPIELAGEAQASVASLGADRFLVVSTVPARGTVVARVVATRPDRFTQLPSPRPPVLEGTVSNADGGPGSAEIHCIATDNKQCGMGWTTPNGAFAIEHPFANDHRHAFDVDVAYAFATGGAGWTASAWAGVPMPGTKVQIQLAPVTHLRGHITWPKGVQRPPPPAPVTTNGPRRPNPPVDPGAVTVSWPEVVTYGGQLLRGLPSVTTRADDYDVPAATTGPILVTAWTADRKYGFAGVVDPKRPQFEVKLATVGTLEVTITGAPIQTTTFVDANLAFGCRAGARCVVDLGDEVVVPGEHLIVPRSGPWQMARVIKVAAATKARISLAFVADLLPGHPGLQLGDDLVVESVAPNGPADGKVKVGDRIVKIAGQRVTDRHDATARLAGAPDSRVEITVERAGKSRTQVLVRAHGTTSLVSPIMPP